MTGRALTRADILRAGDVADLLGFPRSTVYQFAREDRIPHRRRGKALLFIRHEIEAWILEPDQETR